MQTLSELVQSALNQVDVETPSVKLASAADVPEADVPEVGVEPAEKPVTEKVATAAEVLDDSAYALKLAQCLEVAGSIVKTKLAAEASDAVPPAGSKDNAVGTMEATDNVPVNLPPAPKSTVESAVTTNATITEGEMPDSEGDYTGTPDWTNNKEAADAAINEKLEQAALLQSLGETEKAAELLEEAEKIASKTMTRKELTDKHTLGKRMILPNAIGGTIGGGVGGLIGSRGNKRVGATMAAAGGLAGGTIGYVSGRNAAKKLKNDPKALDALMKAQKANVQAAKAQKKFKNTYKKTAGLLSESEKVATGQRDSAIIGGLIPIAAGAGAEEGKGWRTTGGALLGATAGSLPGIAAKNLPLRAIGQIAGGAGGAYLAHGPDRKKSQKKTAEDLSTSDEGIPSHAPSNEEAISLTKAVAKAKTQAEASQYLEQTPTKDPVVEASLDNTEVAKVSSLLNAIKIRGYAQ